MKKTFLNIIIITLAFSLQAQDEEEIKKTVNSDYGFRFDFSQGEDYQQFICYRNIKIYHDDKLVFENKGTEIEVKNDYPSVRKLKNGFEILLYMNDRPLISKLIRLHLVEDEIIKNDLLPSFIKEQNDLDNDGLIDRIGIFEVGECLDNECPYEPILAYSETNEGLVLNKNLSKKLTLEIYGAFYGFKFGKLVILEREMRKKREKYYGF